LKSHGSIFFDSFLANGIFKISNILTKF